MWWYFCLQEIIEHSNNDKQQSVWLPIVMFFFFICLIYEKIFSCIFFGYVLSCSIFSSFIYMYILRLDFHFFFAFYSSFSYSSSCGLRVQRRPSSTSLSQDKYWCLGLNPAVFTPRLTYPFLSPPTWRLYAHLLETLVEVSQLLCLPTPSPYTPDSTPATSLFIWKEEDEGKEGR